MTRKIGILLAVFTVLAITASLAVAGNAHFIGSQTGGTLQNNGSLVVSFKEAGLESGSTSTITVSGTGTADYECINGGGKNPTADNKDTVSAEVSASGDFTATKNGNVVGSLTLSPPGPGSFSCPNGQRLSGPTNVSYTNVWITDEDTGATLSLGDFS
jgi:hypothetical protein